MPIVLGGAWPRPLPGRIPLSQHPGIACLAAPPQTRVPADDLPMTPELSELPARNAAASDTAPAALLPALGALVPALLRRDGDLLAVKDASSGVYVHVDAAMLGWLDRGLDDVIGRKDADLFEPGLAAALRAAEQSALAQPEALVSEHRFDWRGTRQEFSVLRQRLDGAAGPHAAGGSVARPRATAAARGAAGGRARAARAAAACQRAVASRDARPHAARQRNRPVQPRPFRRPVAARGRPVDARAP